MYREINTHHTKALKTETRQPYKTQVSLLEGGIDKTSIESALSDTTNMDEEGKHNQGLTWIKD